MSPETKRPTISQLGRSVGSKQTMKSILALEHFKRSTLEHPACTYTLVHLHGFMCTAEFLRVYPFGDSVETPSPNVALWVIALYQVFCLIDSEQLIWSSFGILFPSTKCWINCGSTIVLMWAVQLTSSQNNAFSKTRWHWTRRSMSLWPVKKVFKGKQQRVLVEPQPRLWFFVQGKFPKLLMRQKDAQTGKISPEEGSSTKFSPGTPFS